MEDIINEVVIKKDSLVKRIVKKIKCKLFCCMGSSCSYGDDKKRESE